MDLKRKISGQLVIEVFANIVLPYVVYLTTQAHIGQVRALLVASLPPIVLLLWAGAESGSCSCASNLSPA